MKEKALTRLSLIDGSVEQLQPSDTAESQKNLEPIFEEIIVKVLTLEGLEQTTQKRIIGFRERKK